MSTPVSSDPPDEILDVRPDALSPVREYSEVLLVIAAVSLLGWFVAPRTSYLAFGQVYLLAVIALSLRVGRWPLIFAGLVSALAWDYLIIPPRMSFSIIRFEDGMTLGTFCVVALIAGQLTAQIRAQEKRERVREKRAIALFHLTRAITAAASFEEAVSAALRQADGLFGAHSALLLAGSAGPGLVPYAVNSLTVNATEMLIAADVAKIRRAAGRFAVLYPSSELVHLPVLRGSDCFGVLVLSMSPATTPKVFVGYRNTLEVFCSQFALLIEREQLRAASEREKFLAESERLHRTLLDSVSHELKTPLAVLRTATQNLKTSGAGRRENLVSEIRIATGRLDTLVDNLINQTRLDSGTLKPKLDWCNIHDLINAAQARLADMTPSSHPLSLDVAPDMPLFKANARLLEQVFINLIHNGIRHTPPGTPLSFSAKVVSAPISQVQFAISDRGPGLPAEIKAHPFQKFRGSHPGRTGGLGLGLSIVRGFVIAQGGDVSAGDNPGGGALFTVTLPYQPHGIVPDE